MQMWKELTGQKIGIRNAYGTTELGGAVYTRLVGLPTGRLASDLMANNEVRIMSLDGSLELEQGQQMPDDTKLTFVGDDWIRTGVVGKVDDNGFLIIEGRKKDLISDARRLVSPFELEEVLLHHPEITNAVVCPVQDPSCPDRRLARAYVVKRSESSLDADSVVLFSRKKAPHLPGLDGGVSFPANIPMGSNHNPEREVLVAQDPEPNNTGINRGDTDGTRDIIREASA